MRSGECCRSGPLPGSVTKWLWDDAIQRFHLRIPSKLLDSTQDWPKPVHKVIANPISFHSHEWHLKIRTIPFRICERLIFFSAKLAVCPPRTSATFIRFRWMLFTAIGMKWPRASGPSNSVSFKRINPCKQVPDTTVPTPGTEYVSSIWNSAGKRSKPAIRVVSKFKNICNNSKLSPVTLDTWKIGHKRCDTKFVALRTTSSCVRTITGTCNCDFSYELQFQWTWWWIPYLATALRTQHFAQQFEIVLQYVRWTHVDFGDDNENRYRQRQCQAQVLFRHTHDTSIGSHLKMAMDYARVPKFEFPICRTHHQHSEIGCMSCHAEHGCLQISLMSRQINECDDFRWFLANFHPIQCAMIGFIHNLAHTIETQNIISHRTRSAGFHFMFVSEEPLTRVSTTVVQLTMRQHAQ